LIPWDRTKGLVLILICQRALAAKAGENVLIALLHGLVSILVITFSSRRRRDGEKAILMVEDNRMGLPEDLDFIVMDLWLLARQLRANLEIRREVGTEFLLTLDA
jgi:two-component sensor histidine kinase